MSMEMLRLFVKEAARDGFISNAERQFLHEKALEYGITDDQLELLIQEALREVSASSLPPLAADSSSTFVTNAPHFPVVPTGNPEVAEGSSFITNLSPSFTSPGFGSTPGPVSNASTPGFNFSQGFTDIEPLGQQGGMSFLQKAHYDRQWVVVKRLLPEHRRNAAYVELFFKEYHNSRKLRHEHIVDVFGRGEDAEGPYFFMEYVDGQPLSKRIPAGGIKDERLIRKIASQVLDALDYAHKKQIVHRDLKPDNILITNRGDNAKLIDFGLAAADRFDDIAGANFVGTRKYAAPEQTTDPAHLDGRADLYAFGLILLEMFTGSTDRKDIDKIGKSYWRNIIHKCLKKDPGQRHANAHEILEEINQYSSRLEITPQPIPQQGQADRARADELEKQRNELLRREEEIRHREAEVRNREKSRPEPSVKAALAPKRRGCLSAMLWTFLIIAALIAFVIYKILAFFSAETEPFFNYDEQDLRERVAEYYQAVETHNFDQMEDYFRPKVDVYFGSRDLNTGDLRIMFNRYWEGTPEERHEIDWKTFKTDVSPDGNAVTVHYNMTYHYRRANGRWSKQKAGTAMKMDGNLKIFYVAGR